jgi:hypothetical protein
LKDTEDTSKIKHKIKSIYRQTLMKHINKIISAAIKEYSTFHMIYYKTIDNVDIYLFNDHICFNDYKNVHCHLKYSGWPDKIETDITIQKFYKQLKKMITHNV